MQRMDGVAFRISSSYGKSLDIVFKTPDPCLREVCRRCTFELVFD